MRPFPSSDRRVASTAAHLASFLALTPALFAQGVPPSIPPEGSSVPPADPYEWYCPPDFDDAFDSRVADFCAQGNFGTPLPISLQTPPALADLDAKNEYDERLRDFLFAEHFRNLGWAHDKGWRFTGPLVGVAGQLGDATSYGSHRLPVQIWYSPEVTEWLCNGRVGDLPDGAMILKLMAGLDDELAVQIVEEACAESPGQTVIIPGELDAIAYLPMVKNSAASTDGWYWGAYFRDDPTLYPTDLIDPPVLDRSGITTDQFYAASGNPPNAPDPNWYPTGYWLDDVMKYPDVISASNQYGQWCLCCHATAISESTFSSLDNVVGNGDRFKLYPPDSGTPPAPAGGPHVMNLVPEFKYHPYSPPLAQPTPEFLAFYDQMDPVDFTEAWATRMPAQTYDHVVPGPDGPDGFVTSDQCIGCHDAVSYLGDFSNMALLETVEGEERRTNLSPYGEWSASPMGLAGRDPIFFSQLQSETNYFPDLKECIEDTCLHCHAVMGQRQLAADTPGQENPSCADLFGVPPPAGVPVGKSLALDDVAQWPGSLDNSSQEYAALGRDGISCTVCHQMSDTALNAEAAYTGNFVTGRPDEINGPYQDVATSPMHNALGITPQFGAQIQDSGVCGTCHNILLPVFTNEGMLTTHRFEQTTHLEWTNSVYGPDGSDEQSCQDCHMPKTYRGQQLEFRIANFESNLFPPSQNRVPDDEITAELRDEYSRHSLHGLNLFMNQMFSQFPLLLGYRQGPWFSRTELGYPSLLLGMESMIHMAERQTATIEIGAMDWTPEGKLQVPVEVTNLTGHYFPSGVGFRRAFIELVVEDEDGNLLWASGRTNSLGAIVLGTTDIVLPSEEPVNNPDAPPQPHYFIVDSEAEAQIYQEVMHDSAGDITTSFLRRFTTVKDNRIRPEGYDPDYFLSSNSPYIQELAVTHGRAATDPDYTDPALTGRDQVQYLITLDPEERELAHRVRARIYNQSIPPAYLQERFRDSTIGPADSDEIDRLWYITSHLDVEAPKNAGGESVMKDWKLFIARAARAVPAPR